MTKPFMQPPSPAASDDFHLGGGRIAPAAGARVWTLPLNDGFDLCITGYGTGIFRLRVRPSGEPGENPLIRYGLVAKGLSPAGMEIATDMENTRLRLPGATLQVSNENGACELLGADGSRLLATCGFDDCVPRAKGYSWKARFSAGDRLYGLGDSTRERVEKSGHKTDIWVSNVTCYVPIPWVMSAGGWGVFINSSWRHTIDCASAAANELRVDCKGGPLDIFLIAGMGFRSLLEQFTTLTGRPCLLPKWAYGLTFVCNQQANAREMLDDCLAFRREGIPCDLVGLEPGWMSEHYDYTVDKKWHPERFFYPPWFGPERSDETFLGAAERLGFKVSLWLCCDYDVTWEEERQARLATRQAEIHEHAGATNNGHGTNGRFHADDFEKDEHFGHGPTYADKITKRDEAWYKHLEKFVAQGASAFKMDGALQVNEHPDRLYGNGMRDDEAHNLYPSLLNKQMALGFRAQTGRRAMIYSSGGYIGIQSFAATWAGDTGGGPKSLISMLNHAFSGHANVSCDMGVFTPAGIHFGFLQPWSQVCSWAYWRHPWLLGEKLGLMFKEYARLRYRLLPYIYTAAHEAARTGWPILRPLPLVHPDEPDADRCKQHYYFGDDLLVGAFTDEMWLPPGETWVNYWTGEVHSGGQWLVARPPEGRGGSLFVRAGAMLPQAPAQDYIGTKPALAVIWEIFPPGPGRKGRGHLVEDDGDSFEHESGVFATTRATCVQEATMLRVEIGPIQGRYAGMPETRSHSLRIHLSRRPQAVLVNGAETGFEFESGCCMIVCPLVASVECIAQRIEVRLAGGS